MRRHAKAIVAISALLLLTLALGASTASAAPPAPTMGAVSAVSYASAHVTGTVDPADQETYYSFERSTDGVNWSGFAYEGPITAGAGVTNVATNLTGLKGGTEYFVRLSALNFAEFNEVHSLEPNPSFTTLPVDPPTVLSADDATNVTYTTAKASGSVERPVGADPAFDADCRFEYVTEDEFTANGFEGASQTPCDVNPVTATGPTAAKADLSGLKPGTTYHLRLVAENAGGADALEATSTFTTLAVAPPTVSIDPVTTFTGTTAHFSGKVNPNGTDPAFNANWHFECTPDCPGLIGGEVSADGVEHPVPADATGLQPNTTYEVTLVASNLGGQSTAHGSFKTAAVAPEAQTLYAGAIATESAVLAANVNPKNSPVTYYFKWGSDESYGNVAPVSAASLGATDNSFHLATTPLTGLVQGATYHFQIVATNTDTAQVSSGVDHTFTTLEPAGPPPPPSSCPNAAIRNQQSSEDLPECRAYERVSPEEKNGNNVASRLRRSVSPDGERITFQLASTSAPGSAGGTIPGNLLGARLQGGWTSEPIDSLNPPGAATVGQFPSYSADLTKSVELSYSALTPGAGDRTDHLYLRDNTDGSHRLLTPNALPPDFFARTASAVAGASSDFSHIAYDSSIPQTSDLVASGVRNAYEWVDGDARLVGFLPDPDGSGPLTEEISPNGSSVGSSNVGLTGEFGGGSVQGAVSRDGSRVFFHTPGSRPISGQIYVREDGTTTSLVSSSQRTDCAGDPSCGGDGLPDPQPDPSGTTPAVFIAADAEHGSKVLFASCEKLTDNSTADSTASTECAGGVQTAVGQFGLGNDLYLYDVDSDNLTDLTTGDPSGADVLGVVGVSDALNRVYFVARGTLADGAVAGDPNLYLWSDGTVKFIATLDDSLGDQRPIDSSNWTLGLNEGKERVTRVTADGGYLAFASLAPLTGYDNRNPAACPPTLDGAIGNPIGNVEGRCLEVFLYGAATGQLYCASCGGKDTMPLGDSLLQSGLNNGSIARVDPFPVNLLPDGSVYFESPTGLVPGDLNGVRDVYQWRDDSLSLISAGDGSSGSSFFDSSDDGHDVFFLTRDRLIPSDRDNSIDVYDARVNGGFLEPNPPTPCVGDGCRSQLSSSPVDPVPATSAFSGPGNPEPRLPNCARGKIKHRGKCVSRKHRHHRKHAKGQHRANANRRVVR